MKKTLSLLMIFIFVFSAVFAEKIVFSANTMSGKTGKSAEETKLEGNAYIKTETMEIKADNISLSGDDYRYIKAEGNVSGVNSKSHMEFTCETLNFDRTTKVATLEGNVSLTDTENDVKANAQIIEYNQDTDVAVLQIKINLTQKKNICSGAYAVYKKNEQMLELSGNAQVKQNNDTFRAQLITLDLQTQDITLDGNVKGSITQGKSTNKKTESTDNKTDNENKSEENETSEEATVAAETIEKSDKQE